MFNKMLVDLNDNDFHYHVDLLAFFISRKILNLYFIKLKNFRILNGQVLFQRKKRRGTKPLLIFQNHNHNLQYTL